MGDGWEWSNAEDYPGYVKYTRKGVSDGDQRDCLRADALTAVRDAKGPALQYGSRRPNFSSAQSEELHVARRRSSGKRNRGEGGRRAAADSHRAAQGHRRPGRGRRAAADRALHRRALPDHRRPRPGEDAAGQDARPDPRSQLQADPVHARPDARRHHRHGDPRRSRAACAHCGSSRGRSSRTSSSPTRSTARRRRRRPRCSKRCRSTTSPRRDGPTRSSGRSSCSPRRTRSSWKARIRCRKRSSIASCSTS